MTPLVPVYLSVVIPAYNEERRIRPTLARIAEYLDAQGYRSEVIVVDDGSKDGTADAVRQHAGCRPNVRLLQCGVNGGKGYAVQQGMLRARGEYLLFSDADLSTPIEEVEKLFPWMQSGFDVVIGSRGLSGSDIRIHQPWYREHMGKVFNGFVRMLVLGGIRDTQCGFKLFRRSVAHEIFPRQQLDGFCFDVELLWLARKFGFRIKEVPIVWYNEEQSRVHPVKDARRMLMDLIRIRIRDWRGGYGDGKPGAVPVKEAEALEWTGQRKP